MPSGTEDYSPALREMLGYLNLSSGVPDARFQRRINELFGQLEASASGSTPPWRELSRLLLEELELLHGASGAFAEVGQAEAAVRISLELTPPAYRRFHKDQLTGRTDGELFRPFFLARSFEAVLQEGGPWDETERIVEGAIKRLNDYIGYRPVAVLENDQRMEPYEKEWIRPIPLYLREAGVGVGRFHDVIVKGLEILRSTGEDLLRQAGFDPENLDELAFDPRPYDFDHPANRRLNYQFGQWDPNLVDNRGFYRRFVLTDVALEALMERAEAPSQLPREELIFEAAAVLAGVLLMASGVSGPGPGAHDSTTTLSTLVKRIASYRDDFYVWLLSQVGGAHGQRLREEARQRRQPFAVARQALNQSLSRRRAVQQQRVFLATLYARMGFPEASRRQVSQVAIPSARISCEIDCQLTSARLDIDRGELTSAARRLREAEDLLQRGIECGAIVDPWNILGFGGQFSLFPALENTIRDHRVYDLIEMMAQVFDLHARLQSEAAAAGAEELRESVSSRTQRLALWWDRFASVEVEDLNGFSGEEAADSASRVAEALAGWREAGEAAGDIAFWRRHVDVFESPKAYALVVESLLERGDFRASMALIMQWLSQAESVPLEDNDHSFNRLAMRWMNALRLDAEITLEERWDLTRKFIDFLEANADEHWQVPHFTWGAGEASSEDLDEEDDEEDDDNGLFAAAYEGVVFRDSTDDGFEGSVFDGGEPTEFELDEESTRITRRLAFLAAVAELWKVAVATLVADGAADDPAARSVVDGWLAQAQRNVRELRRLLREIRGYEIPRPSGTHDSLVEYDRRQTVKEVLLENSVKTAGATASSARTLRSVATRTDDDRLPNWERAAVGATGAIARGDPEALRQAMPELMSALAQQPLLYVPLARDGNPEKIVAARSILQFLHDLLTTLPRLGLLRETCDLLRLARQMEAEHPVGPGAVSEFDRLFCAGFQALVEAFIVAAENEERHSVGQSAVEIDRELVDSLNVLTEKLLKLWLAHSGALRLSALEGVMDQTRWQSLVDFVSRYGDELFTPRFLNEGNLRAILHEGAEAWLEELAEHPTDEAPQRLLEDTAGEADRAVAAETLDRIIQALLENYAEYNDYNHTTTHSDRGSMLHSLLDFLRLKASYDRMAWNLRPVTWAHETLVRRNRSNAAELWRRSVAEQTSDSADQHLLQYSQLTERYGMRLPTVADRLRECFVRTLDIDRIRALIGPSMNELEAGEPPRRFEVFEQEVNELAHTPTGVGLDLPDWLLALEEEAQETQAKGQVELSHRSPDHIPRAPLSLFAAREQIDAWEFQPPRRPRRRRRLR